MILSLREKILEKAKSLAPEKLYFEELDMTVFVSRASAKKAVELGEIFKTIKDVPADVAMVIAFAVDENGRNLFTAEDADIIGELPLYIVNKISKMAMKLNGFTSGEDQVTSAEKN